jgi:large subunit GTPase 1
VVVQIVDARNPLLFYCQDLEKYVKEVDGNKVSIVLVNKSDFLTAKQRLEWLRYFERHSIRVAFWSAVLSHQLNDLANLKEHDDDQDEEEEEDDDETTKSHENNEEEEEDDEEEGDDEEDDDEGDKLANKFGLLGDEKSGSDEEDVDQDNHSDDQDDEEEEEEEDEEENDVEEEEKEKKTNSEPKPISPKNTEKSNIVIYITDHFKVYF